MIHDDDDDDDAEHEGMMMMLVSYKGEFMIELMHALW